MTLQQNGLESKFLFGEYATKLYFARRSSQEAKWSKMS